MKNKGRLKGDVKEYKTLLENFCISCENPTYRDYLNFSMIDVRFYPQEDQEVLVEGFFTMHNTTLSALELLSIEDNDLRRN